MKILSVEKPSEGLTLAKFIQKEVGKIPTSLLHKLTRKGNIRINGKRCQPDSTVSTGDKIRFPDLEPLKERPTQKKKVSPQELNEFKSWIIFENDECFVLNKPSGIAVQGGTKQTIYIDLFLDALAEEYGQRPCIVHRLDKQTSGLLVIAKTVQFAAKVGKLFQERKISKTYLALVEGKPNKDSGEINLSLSKKMVGKSEKVIANTPEAKTAVTRYKVLQTFDLCSLIELKPLTGRMHQLRAHCTYGLKTPILGDEKYGAKNFYKGEKVKGLYLHARSLDIPDFSMTFKAEVPDKFFHLIKDLDPNL